MDSPINQPYHVRTDGGIFVSGHETATQADKDAAERNERAEKLGIKTRYVSAPKPQAQSRHLLG